MRDTCVLLCVGLLFFACSETGGDDDGGGDDGYSEGGSPTGTTLEPRDGVGENGYVVLDEVCGETDSPTYIERFETPMFRDVVVVGDVAYLVDGSLLWAVDLQDPASPVRISLTRLVGHPKSLRAGQNETLLVAAGEAGVLSVDISDPTSPSLVNAFPVSTLAMDIALDEDGRTAYVAAGADGLLLLDVIDPADPTLLAQVEVGGFGAAVDYEDGLVYVAACESLGIVDVSQPLSPVSLGNYWVPNGHGRELDVVGDELFVAGGEALLSFNVTDPTKVVWTGVYDDPEAEGFYVNAVVVRDGVAYIAAGDESVRAVSVMSIVDGGTDLPSTDSGEPPSLDDPEDLPPADSGMDTIEVASGDPIGVALSGELLLVLGNFRWMGERLLRVMTLPTPGEMVDVGAYVQPNSTRGIEEYSDLLLLHGPDGEEKLVDPSTGLEQLAFQVPAQVSRAAVFEDRLLLLSEEGTVYDYDAGQVESVFPAGGYDIAAGSSYNYASSYEVNGIVGFSTDGSFSGVFSNGVGDAFLGFSWLLYHGDSLLSYDWALGRLHAFRAEASGSLTHLSETDVGLCELYDFADYYSGQKNMRSRLAAEDQTVALLCPFDENDRSSVLMFELSSTQPPTLVESFELPNGRFFDIDFHDGDVYGVGFDNNTYTSTLVRFSGAAVVRHEFDGQANGVLVIEDEVFVTDGDLGLRRFELDGSSFVELGHTQYFTQGS